MPVVPDHTLIRPIGKGGFGEVWLARNVVGTYRAVKIVSRSAVRDAHDFNREFNGMQRFEPVSRSHEGLVDILQIGRAADESYFYYVMELGDDVEVRQDFAPDDYIPKTLAEEFRRLRRIPAEDAALIGAQLAEALSFLHDHGLIHRDVKPSNILFVQGHARIGDPGLVTTIEASQSLGGTLGFIAPEGPGTPKADIYALGKLLYVVSTGKGPSEFPLLPAEMTSFPDAAYLRRLNHIILQACSYNPAERYSTAEEMRKDLLEVHAGGSPGETRKRLRFARRIGVVLAFLLLLILGFYFRAQLQAKAERGRLARSYKETAVRMQDDNDAIGALPYLGSVILNDPDDERRADAATLGISFIWRHGPRLLKQWYFTNSVNHLAFAPSGNELAVACADGTVWTWRWQTQRPVPKGRHGDQHVPAEAESLAMSGDSRWLASVGTDATLRFWQMDAPDSQPRVVHLGVRIYSIAFHPRDNNVAIGCADGSVYLVDVEKGAPQLVFRHASDEPAIISIAFSPDGGKLLAGSRSGWMREYDLTKGQVTRETKLLWVYDVAFSTDGSMNAAASDSRAHLNPFAEIPPARLRHAALVRSVSFDPTSRKGQERLLTSCFDRTVRLWSVESDMEIMPPIHTDHTPTCARFSPDSQTVAIATLSGMVRIYQLPVLVGNSGQSATAVASGGSRYARVQDSTNLVVFEAHSNSIVRQMTMSGSAIAQFDLNRNGTHLLTRQMNGTDVSHFEVWEVGKDSPVAVTNLQGDVYGAWSPQGNCVVFRQRNALILWQPEHGTSSAWPWSLKSLFNDLELSSGVASSLLAAAWESNVLILSTTNNSRIASHSFPIEVSATDIDPTGTRIVVGDNPPGINPSHSYVWSIPDWKRLSPPLVHEDGIFHSRFSPSGRWLILTDQNGGCVVYDAHTWQSIPLRQNFGMITDSTFSQDERFVATLTGTRGGVIPTIRIWELPSGNAVTPLLHADASAWGRLRFLGGDRWLMWSASTPPMWRRWNLEKLKAPPKDLVALSQLLSCQRVGPLGVSVPLEARELDHLWRQLWTTHADWFDSANP